MKFIKIIVFMVVIFSVLGGQAEEIYPSNMDDTTLLQYALQLQKKQQELFAGAQGILVMEIVPNSQAEKKGLQRGDIVVAYNGQPMNSAEQLINSVQANAAEPQVELRFIRAGVLQTVVLKGGQVGISLTDIMLSVLELQVETKEISLKQFMNEFYTAVLANDSQKIGQLFSENPNITVQVLQQLAENIEKNDKENHALVEFVKDLRQIMSSYHNSILANLQKEGEKAYDKSDYQIALEKWQTGLQQARKIGDKHYISQFLIYLGKVYIHLRQYQKALDYFQQSLEIKREIGEKPGIVSSLINLGMIYHDLGQYRKALDYFQHAGKLALAMFSEIGNKPSVGNSLTILGMVYEDLGQYQKSLDYYQQALAIYRKIGDTHEIGNNLNNLGIVYNNLGQHRKALDYCQQALTIAREISDKRGEVVALSNLGTIYKNLGQYRKSLKYHRQALPIIHEIGEKHLIGKSLNNLGVVYSNIGQHQKALDYYKRALKIQRKIDNKEGVEAVGTSLVNIGGVYTNLGQYRKALNYYQQALAIVRKTGDKNTEDTTLSNIGGVYTNLGQYRKALDYYQQSLAIAREIGDKRSEGIVLINFGVVYYDLGQYRKALDYLQQALAIVRKIGNKREEGVVLDSLGVLYDKQEQYRKVLDYHKQALAIAREIGNKEGEGLALGNIGVVYNERGQYGKALNFHQKALTIFREIIDNAGIGQTLSNLGIVYLDLGEYQKAKAYFQNSIIILKKLDMEDWRAFRGLAFTEIKLNQFNIAITHYEQAIDNIEKLRRGLEKEQKLSFMLDKWQVYNDLIALLQMLHKKHPNKGYDRKAIKIFERKQGRVFLEEMGESGARRFAGVPENISQLDREFEQQIAATRKHRTDALAKGKDAEPHQQLLEKLEAEQAVFEKTLQRDYPAYYALKYPKPVALENLQKDVLQAGELMLIYNVREENTDLWIVGKEHFSMFNLALTKEQIQEEVNKFRDIGIESILTEIDIAKKEDLENIELKRHLQDAVDGSLPELVKVSHALYQQLLPEAARELVAKADTLYVVPTGGLYKLPFEALVTVLDEEEPHYLIQDYAIAYLSSASLLETLRDANQKRRDTETRQALLAFADPIFPQKNCKKSDDSTVKGLRTRAYRNLVGSSGCIPQLPATKDEALNIAKLFNVTPENLYLGERASLENVLLLNEDHDLYDFRYVLFSTHAVLPNELSYINQPAVLLSYPEKGGYLTMADVFGLEMNADLVTLSACNTGRGENVKGEGVVGLTRAFMYAGTPAVSVSLWSVESKATQQLTQAFFSKLKDKRPLAESLRQAKLAMLKGELDEELEDIYRHPYFWAGFVVFGDGR